MIAAQPFDGFYLRVLDLPEGNDARAHRLSIDQHSARAALAFTATFLCSGEHALLAQHVEKAGCRIGGHLRPLAVQRDLRHIAGQVESVSGIAGISRRSRPMLRNAFTTAGAGPSIGSSPSPFAPNGPPGYGFSIITTSSSGMSS